MSNSDSLFPSNNLDALEATMRGWLEAFVRGFSETRSLTHPYTVQEIRPSIWLLSDAMRRIRGTYRLPSQSF
ncbi:MAG: hypothetical protein JWL77_5846 [Chthonomonadaceae bacterium]|nr:hypothetical protein [Chthonomonadaceae bacterium]